MGRKMEGSGTNEAFEKLLKHTPPAWGVEADGYGVPQASYAYESPREPVSKWAEIRKTRDGTWEASVGEGRGQQEVTTGLESAKQAARAAESLIQKHFRGGGQTERQRSRQYSNRGGRSDSGGMFDDLF